MVTMCNNCDKYEIFKQNKFRRKNFFKKIVYSKLVFKPTINQTLAPISWCQFRQHFFCKTQFLEVKVLFDNKIGL